LPTSICYQTSSHLQEGKFVRQTGGKGKFGHVYVRLEPLDVEAAGKEYEFAEEVVGGVVPKEFFGAVDKGIQERTNLPSCSIVFLIVSR
jgi:translation elongation factor EF-G